MIEAVTRISYDQKKASIHLLSCYSIVVIPRVPVRSRPIEDKEPFDLPVRRFERIQSRPRKGNRAGLGGHDSALLLHAKTSFISRVMTRSLPLAVLSAYSVHRATVAP